MLSLHSSLAPPTRPPPPSVPQRYRLDHVLKERYPSFPAALGDLDDALSLVHLFAALPACPHVRSDRTAAARRLAREWQYFVARSHCLKKVRGRERRVGTWAPLLMALAPLGSHHSSPPALLRHLPPPAAPYVPQVFLSIKGVYYQAEVDGVPITWLAPWQFAQDAPADVDYRVMLTFLELHETLLQFVHYKLYTERLKAAYPPAIRAPLEEAGGHLAAVDGSAPAPAAGAGGSSAAALSAALLARAQAIASGKEDADDATIWRGGDPAVAARIRSLKQRMRLIAASEGNTGEAAGSASAGSGTSSGAASGHAGSAAASAAGVAKSGGRKGASSSSSSAAAAPAAASASIYDFVDAEADDDAADEEEVAAMAAASAGADSDLGAFASSSSEARLVLEKARASRALARLFRGCVFFLSREVPREPFEFMVCAFGGRVGWEGPGSPYARDSPSVTHVVLDRPVPPGGLSASLAPPGKEAVQPQWVADSINARMLLPTAKYAPGAVLPVSGRKGCGGWERGRWAAAAETAHTHSRAQGETPASFPVMIIR